MYTFRQIRIHGIEVFQVLYLAPGQSRVVTQVMSIEKARQLVERYSA